MFGVRARPRGATAGERILPWGTRRRSLLRAPVRAIRFAREHGWGAFARRLMRPGSWLPLLLRRADPEPSAMTPADRYLLWSSIHHRNARILRRKARRARALDGPTISVLLPVYEPQPGHLERALASVTAQLYPRWQLCVVDDASPSRSHMEGLHALAASDERVTLVELRENAGISGATNRALEDARGAYVAMLDHDDELAPDALFEVASVLAADPSLDLVYTDEDKIDEAGSPLDAFFKPGWSPDLERSTNYVNHLKVVRTELVRSIGGFRSVVDGAQDFDLVLRVTEATDRIGHVPLPLYSWRAVDASLSASDDAKPWAYEAGMRALRESLERDGANATVEPGSFPGAYDVRYASDLQPDDVVAIVDGNVGVPLDASLDAMRAAGASVVLAVEGSEPWAARMNAAAAEEAGGKLLLFLRGDAVPISESWLERMIEQAARAEVAVVGVRVVDRQDRTTHEGVVVGAERPTPIAHAAYRPDPELTRNVSAVSAACMMVRSEVFRALEGFDERMSATASDVDFCLRAMPLGGRVVYIPRVVVRSLDPAQWIPPHRDPIFRARWKGYRDPYYNQRFRLDEPYVLRIA